MGKNDFMNLFLTQMSNQSPTDPMDSGAMMAQLAQLGSMEQLENLNAGMNRLNASQRNISRFQALQFLEKDVMSETDQVSLTQSNGKPVYYSLDRDVDNLKVIVEEKDGSPVFSQSLGLVQAGRHEFVWDGKNDAGTLMGDGKYNVRFVAGYADGSSSLIKGYNMGKVSRVEYRNGEPWVQTSGGMLPISRVKTVDNTTERAFGNANPLPLIRNLPPKRAAVAIGGG